jgi:hypothetical protein
MTHDNKARDELRDYICRVAFSKEYMEIWAESVAAKRIDGIMADVDAYAESRVAEAQLELCHELWQQAFDGKQIGDIFNDKIGELTDNQERRK